MWDEPSVYLMRNSALQIVSLLVTRFPPFHETVDVCLVDRINICIYSSRDPKACTEQFSSLSQRKTSEFILQETIKNKQGIQRFRQCRGGRNESAAHSVTFELILLENLCLMWLRRKCCSPKPRGETMTDCLNGF